MNYIRYLLRKGEEVSDRYVFAIMFFSALAVRLICLIQFKSHPFFVPDNQEWLDPDVYHRLALQILNGGGSLPTYSLAPLYTYYLALIYYLFGVNFLIPRIIQIVLGSLSIIFIYLIAKNLFNKKSAFISALIGTLYPVAIFYETQYAAEGLVAPLVPIMLYTFLQYEKEYRRFYLIVGSFIFAVIILGRPNCLLFLPFLIVWVIRDKANIKKLSSAVIVLTTVVTAILPVLVKNYIDSSDFIFISNNGGVTFYSSNNKEADGAYIPLPGISSNLKEVMFTAKIEAEKEVKHKLRPSEVSSFYYKKGIEFILENPSDYIKLLGKKFMLIWNSLEIQSYDDYSYLKENTMSVLKFLPFSFILIGPFSILGIYLAMREHKRVMILNLFLLAYTISLLIFYVCSRFRMPMISILIVFAGYALIETSRCIAKFKGPEIIRISIIIATLFILTNLDFGQYDTSLSYYKLGLFHAKNKNYSKAMIEYQNALMLDGSNNNKSGIHNNIGLLYVETGQSEKAIMEYQAALKYNPKSEAVYINLATLYEKRKEYEKAQLEYKKALVINPENPSIYFRVARLLAEKPESYNEAIDMFKKGLSLAPGDLRGHFGLGDLYVTMGDRKRALIEYETALQYNPNAADLRLWVDNFKAQMSDN